MKTFSKILGLLVLILLLVLVVLGFAITYLFDPNDYKEHIRTLARDKAHIELKLDGDIGWSLFPWLGLELHDTRIASLAAPEEPIADVRLIGLSVKALPLLRKKIEMSDIRVQGLTLNLKRDEQGQGNWQTLGQAPNPASKPSAAPQPPTAPSTPADSAQAQRISLDIDSLRLTDGKVIYQDARTGKTLTAEGIALSTGAIAQNRDIPIKLEVFIGTNQPVVRTRNLIQASLQFDRSQGRYLLENIELSGAASGEPLAGKTLNYSASAQAIYDQASDTAEISHVKIHANELEALGELKLRQINQDLTFEGALSIARFNARSFLEALGQKLPEMADPQTLSNFEFNSLLEGSKNSLRFNDMSLSLDQSHITGTLSIKDFTNSALNLALTLDSLNLDRYLAPKTHQPSQRQAEVKEVLESAGSQGTTTAPAAPTTSAWSTQPLIDAKSLNRLNLNLTLSAKELTLKDWPLYELSLKAQSRNGQTRIERFDTEVKGGKLALTGTLNSQQTPFTWTLAPNVKNLPLSLLFKEQTAPVKGLLQLKGNLSTSGNSEQELINALAGNADFALLDGVLVDANLEQQLCRAIATLNRKALTNLPTAKDTPFNTLQGTLSIRNGVATNPDLLTRIPGLTLKGNGDLDLRVMGMDYRVGVIIEGDQRVMPDQACQVNQRYVGLEWPLHCRGPIELGAKACRMDNQGLTKVATQLATQTLSEKIEEKLGDKASPELKDALKKLFNR